MAAASSQPDGRGPRARSWRHAGLPVYAASRERAGRAPVGRGGPGARCATAVARSPAPRYGSPMPAPVNIRLLPRDPSLRVSDQRDIALFVAQLDDQSRRLEQAVAGLDPAALEWQPAPGRNSTGMLLAHIALTEVFWIGVAAGRGRDRGAAEAYGREVLGHGLDDDGMPLAPGGRHPAVLAGWTVDRYVGLLRRARANLRDVVATWTDADLAGLARYRDRETSREWILYHLLEHYAQHAGQSALVQATRTGTATG
jgi:uncharacterized damage-inducible protein DinB